MGWDRIGEDRIGEGRVFGLDEGWLGGGVGGLVRSADEG